MFGTSQMQREQWGYFCGKRVQRAPRGAKRPPGPSCTRKTRRSSCTLVSLSYKYQLQPGHERNLLSLRLHFDAKYSGKASNLKPPTRVPIV